MVRLAMGAAVAALGISAALGFLLYRHAHPPRASSTETPTGLFLQFEETTFEAVDGVALSGWWIPGKPHVPVLILCHDRGGSRADLVGLAPRFSEAGYSILLFDFRGHGTSGGTSSFGILEKRDLLGAIDWVGRRPEVDGTRVGVVGVGMGAYAGILAAAERPQLRALVLDSPYLNAGAEFAAASLPEGRARTWLTGWSVCMYDLFFRVRSSQETTPVRAALLGDRDLLFLAPRDELFAEDVRSLYETIPDSRTHDKNLLLLPATRVSALYNDDRVRYDEAVLGFFRSYLPAETRPGALTAKARPRRR